VKNWLGNFNVSDGINKRVVGFYTDNWLADQLIIAPKKYVQGHVLYIAGKPYQNSTITVHVGGRVVKQQDLLADVFCKIELPSESFDNEQIICKFSNSMADAMGRRLSFLLQDTNLFTEQDIF
jgi:hypothetical protein